MDKERKTKILEKRRQDRTIKKIKNKREEKKERGEKILNNTIDDKRRTGKA